MFLGTKLPDEEQSSLQRGFGTAGRGGGAGGGTGADGRPAQSPGAVAGFGQDASSSAK